MSVALGAGSLQVPGELGVGWVAAQPRGAGLWRLDARSSSTIFHTLLRQRGVLHEGFFFSTRHCSGKKFLPVLGSKAEHRGCSPAGAGAARGRVRWGRLVKSQGTAQGPRHFVLLLPRVDTARGCGPLISFISSASVSFVKPLGDGKSSTPLVISCKAGCTHQCAFPGWKGFGRGKMSLAAVPRGKQVCARLIAAISE